MKLVIKVYAIRGKWFETYRNTNVVIDLLNKTRIMQNVDVAYLERRSNTAHLLCLKMSQHAPVPILETPSTPLH